MRPASHRKDLLWAAAMAAVAAIRLALGLVMLCVLLLTTAAPPVWPRKWNRGPRP